MKTKKEIRIIFKNLKKCRFKPINGTILHIDEIEKGYKLIFEDNGGNGSFHGIIEVESEYYGFSFKPMDVNFKNPIFSSRLGVAVTSFDDQRSFDEIANCVKNRGLFTDAQRPAFTEEFSFARATNAPWHRCPTFLGVFGNVNIWEVGFRGFPIEEKQHFDLYDYFIPRKNWDRVDFGEDAKRVVYRYVLGRGMGYNPDLKRKNYKGYLPSVIATLNENGIRYTMQAFSDSLEEDISSDGGTHYLSADKRSAGNVLIKEQMLAFNTMLNQIKK